MLKTTPQELNVILHGMKHQRILQVNDDHFTSMTGSIEYQYILVSILSRMAMGEMEIKEAFMMMFSFGIYVGHYIEHPEQVPSCPTCNHDHGGDSHGDN